MSNERNSIKIANAFIATMLLVLSLFAPMFLAIQLWPQRLAFILSGPMWVLVFVDSPPNIIGEIALWSPIIDSTVIFGLILVIRCIFALTVMMCCKRRLDRRSVLLVGALMVTPSILLSLELILNPRIIRLPWEPLISIGRIPPIVPLPIPILLGVGLLLMRQCRQLSTDE